MGRIVAAGADVDLIVEHVDRARQRSSMVFATAIFRIPFDIGADLGCAMAKVRTHGLAISYQRAGHGPLVVFVHGAAEDGRTWTPQLTGLRNEFTVVAWDEPGAGHSSDVPDHFDLADYAHCLGDLIEAIALGPAHIVGLSWGGTLALELYRQRPQQVKTLILADTYAGWKGSLDEEELRARVAGVHQKFAAPPHEFDPTLPGLFASEPPAPVKSLVATMAADVRPASMQKALLLQAETDQRDLLSRIDVPTLLIWGELDARSSLSVARQFEESIVDAQLVVIPAAGHLSNLERPERFNQAVREFCRTADR